METDEAAFPDQPDGCSHTSPNFLRLLPAARFCSSVLPSHEDARLSFTSTSFCERHSETMIEQQKRSWIWTEGGAQAHPWWKSSSSAVCAGSEDPGRTHTSQAEKKPLAPGGFEPGTQDDSVTAQRSLSVMCVSRKRLTGPSGEDGRLRGRGCFLKRPTVSGVLSHSWVTFTPS